MKTNFFYVLLACFFVASAQVPTYYNDVDLNLTGSALQSELSTKVTNTQSTVLSYTPGVWNALKQADRNPNNANEVLLIYGYNDNDGLLSTDRTRNRESNGGAATDWNREHAYPRSLGNPNLGSTGPGSDAHHLRPSDPARNSSRSNRKFGPGSGNSTINSQGNFYPGDEWKGDVARMMLYMYIRYGNRCLPSNVAVGTTNASDSNMINLLLDWNVQDPVNAFELNRNDVIAGIQGNRNPFIDNPAFATTIWGGPQAEDRFGNTGGGGNNPNPDPGNPTINCSVTVTSFPYNESFEGVTGAWSQDTTDDFNWTNRTGGTPSNNTGPSSATAGSKYLYMESSTPNFSTKRAILNSPCFNLTPASNATFTFSYHMYGASNMGSLALEASSDGTNWTSVWSRSSNQGNSWREASVDLNSYAGATLLLRFNGTTGTTWRGDMAIDKLRLSTTAGNTGGGDTTPPATVDVNLRFTLDNYPEETSWEILDSNNQAVFTGGTYGSQPDGSTINLARSLAPGCYTLVVRDAFGDGICCSYGNGSYALTEVASGNVLASGGNFTTQDSTSFCIDGASRSSLVTASSTKPSRIGATSIQLYPNPADAVLHIETGDNEIQSLQVYNTLGQLILAEQPSVKSINVSEWKNGAYYMKIQTAQGTITKTFMVK